MKRATLLACIVMMTLIVSVNVFAEEQNDILIREEFEEIADEPYNVSTHEKASLNKVAGGICGNNVIWSLNRDGVLTISGKGDMQYISCYSDVPWRKYCSRITSVIIEDGITNIANYAFYKCEQLETAYIPASVSKIEDMSFAGCKNLKNIYYSGYKNDWEVISNGSMTYSSVYYASKNISSCDINLSASSFTYTGSAITPQVSIYYNSEKLTEGEDYSLTYYYNIKVGTATITITGQGNYYGTTKKEFSITAADISNMTVKLSQDTYTYSGPYFSPSPDVLITYGSVTLTKDTDFTVSYSNNTNVGTATVTVTGKGNYTGSVKKNFTIKQANISGAEISLILTEDDYEFYEGEAITPTVYSVEVNSIKLTSGTDYTVSYSNNINVGTATVTITGKGNYTGTAKKNFTIKAVSLSYNGVDASIKLETTVYYYDGQKKTPAVTVKDKWGDKLVEGKDYTVSYSNNKDVGTAKVTVTGKGNYKGSVKASFKIKMLKGTSISSLKNTGSKQMTVQWKKVSGVTGYQIQYCKKGSKKNVKTITVPKKGKVSKKISGLKNGKNYNVRIRTYKKDSGNIYYSEWTSKETVYVDAPRISTTSISMKVGDQRVVEILGTTKNVNWTSSNSSVASVTSKGRVGYITGNKAGTAIMSCTVGGKRFSCKVTVKANNTITIRVNVTTK